LNLRAISTSVFVACLVYFVAFGVVVLDISFPSILRAAATLLLLAVLFVITSASPIMGLRTVAVLLIPQKILINQAVLINSLPLMETLLLAAIFSARPVRKELPGRPVLLVCLVFVGLQFVVSPMTVDAVRGMFGIVSFCCIFLIVAPTLHADEAVDVIRDYVNLTRVFAVLALVTYNWGALQRLGPELALNSNNTAQFSCIGLVGAFYLWRRGKITPKTGITVLILLTPVLFLAASRTFMLASVLGILLSLNLTRAALVLGALSAVVSALLLVIPVQDSGVLQQLTKGLAVRSLEDVSTFRWILTIRGLELYYEAPFFGTGMGTSRALVDVYREAHDNFLPIHNLFLLYLVEFGIVGPLLVIWWLVTMVIGSALNGARLCVAFSLAFFFSGMISGPFFDAEYAVIWAASAALVARKPLGAGAPS
jgi:hypothetical protein